MADSNYQLLSRFAKLKLNVGEVSRLSVDVLSVECWNDFFSLAQAHGMLPLLAHHVRGNDMVIPSDQKRILMAMAIEHKAFSQARYAAIKEVYTRFTELELDFVALKGVALSQMLYEPSSLRPMRDVDLLLSIRDCEVAADALRGLGYDLPDQHQNRWEDGIQHLPNAQKLVGGFNISIELHHNAIHRDSNGSLSFSELGERLQNFLWQDLIIKTLNHVDMLNQLCRHIQGPDGERLIKLVNLLDIVLYAEKFIEEIPWSRLQDEQPHVANTLRCIHMIVPLSDELKNKVGHIEDGIVMSGAGQPMGSFRYVFGRSDWSFFRKLEALFFPSIWWLHLYYEVRPQSDIRVVRFLKHPAKVIFLVLNRAFTWGTSFWLR